MDRYYNPYQPQQRPVYQQPQQMPQQEMFNVRAAASREEAAAMPVDFFRPTIILGLNHGTIYFKRFNSETGETCFDAFRYSPDAGKAPEYVTVESFDQFKNAVAQALNQMRGGEQGE